MYTHTGTAGHRALLPSHNTPPSGFILAGYCQSGALKLLIFSYSQTQYTLNYLRKPELIMSEKSDYCTKVECQISHRILPYKIFRQLRMITYVVTIWNAIPRPTGILLKKSLAQPFQTGLKTYAHVHFLHIPPTLHRPE